MGPHEALRRSAVERLEHAEVSDEALVARVVAGEHWVYEILIRRNCRRLFRLAWAVVGDYRQAEDVVACTFVNAFGLLSRLEPGARFATWVARLAIHQALQMPASGGASGGGSSNQLETAIRELPQPLRLAFVLRELERLSTADTAEALGITPTNAKVRLHRARTLLGRELSALAAASRADIAPPVGDHRERAATASLDRLRARSRRRAPDLTG